MKRTLLCAMLVGGCGALALAQSNPSAPQAITPTTITDGLVNYTWRDGVAAKIVCPPERTCDIRLTSESPKDIRDIVSPGSTKNIGQYGWTIDQGSGEAPYIYVTPVEGSPVTNLIVTTRKHRYSMTLIPTFSTHTSYAIEDRPTPGPNPTPTPTPVPTDYLFTIDDPMHAPFVPTVLPEREGDLTIVTLPPGYYAKPDIAQYDEHGKHWEIVPIGESWDPDRNAYVVTGIYPALVLYVGDGKDQVRVIIRRKSA
jgi:hypothetical protein